MDIDRQISKPLPDYSTSYEDSAIFQSVNGKKLGKQIKTLNTTSIIEFKRFIDYRYYPEKRYSNRKVKDYHKKDLQCLEDLKIELSNKNNIREKIKNIAIHELVTEIENIIQKLKSIP